jgi:RNA polymerase sigma factor (sigma-70 family)
MSAAETLTETVAAAAAGDFSAFARLVELTQAMAYAVALGVLREPEDAQDAVQEAYVTSFKRLPELLNREAFAGWLRRIVVATALNQRRRRRTTWLPLTESSSPPFLDEQEESWSEGQQRLLARALLTLSADERRICELHYHGGWSTARLAREAHLEPAAMRKRLQRVRDKLRKEIEMDEQRILSTHPTPKELPTKIAELLAQPRLVDIPENPVAAVATLLRGAFQGYSGLELPEDVDLGLAQERLGGDAVYIDRTKLHYIEADHVLRYDLTLPLLLDVRWQGSPLRLCSSGKVYRREAVSATHLEAFHQLELFALDEREKLDPWAFAGNILNAVDRVLPRAELRVTPTDYPMCRRAWSLDVLRSGEWIEILAWGEYADWVLRGIRADPEQQVALGAGVGLERLAALKYGIDDIRKMASTTLA